jgi:hypothetical protein
MPLYGEILVVGFVCSVKFESPNWAICLYYKPQPETAFGRAHLGVQWSGRYDSSANWLSLVDSALVDKQR